MYTGDIVVACGLETDVSLEWLAIVGRHTKGY
ncbi:helix-turn-helix domain-containing protein [Pantoea dispersa]|nr:helix-turn-helix domain-containing protein [Pantoea dispersa]